MKLNDLPDMTPAVARWEGEPGERDSNRAGFRFGAPAGCLTRRARLVLRLCAVAAMPLLLHAQVNAPLGMYPGSGRGAAGHMAIGLYSIAGFWSYYSRSAPAAGYAPGGGTFGQAGGGGYGTDSLAGGAATIGFSRPGSRSSFSVIYSPSYFRRVQQSGWRAINHSLNLNYARNLTPRLALNTIVGANISDLDSLAFSGGVYALPGVAAPTFDDFAASILSGRLADDQIASLLTGTAVLPSPAQSLFFGSRSMSATMRTALSYSLSKRLSISGFAGLSRYQHLSGSSPSYGLSALYGSGLVTEGFIVPQATFARAGLGLSYSLTPRTTFSANASSGRTLSRYQQTYVISLSAGISRVLGRRWYAQGHYGTGVVVSTRSDYNVSGPRGVFGGVLGHHRGGHSMAIGGNKTVSDPYGVGGSSSYGLHARWSWSPSVGRWGIYTNGGRHHYSSVLGNAADPAANSHNNVNTWMATCGLTHRLSSHVSAQVQYAYTTYTGRLTGVPYRLSQNIVRVSMAWSPMVRIVR